MSRCRRVRDALLRAPGGPRLDSGPRPEDLRRHLDSCAACRRFAQRSRTVAGALGTPRSDAAPDAGFAARVVARLPAAPDVARARFTWAAVRLLPAAAALLLVLLGWSVLGTAAESVAAGDDADVLSWILEQPAVNGGLGAGS